MLSVVTKSKGVSVMNKAIKIAVITALILVVGMVIAVKQQGNRAASEPTVTTNPDTNTIAGNTADNSKDLPKTENLPRLVDLGADKCIPCKLMAPILDELKREYAGRLKVEFIDVWKNPNEAKKHKINIIPTQIFY